MQDEKPHILIVDDDDRLRALLVRYLGEQGFMATATADAAEARRKMAWFAFDAMILDVMMPGESGLELLASLGQGRTMPVLMLSAMAEADDRIKGLETGAEDYLVKPFEPKELVLRVKTLLKRQLADKQKTRQLRFGDYLFDVGNGQLRRGEMFVALTTSESAILKCLGEQVGKPVSREELASCMPGGGNERSVDVQVTRLRKKIEESEGKPLYLQTVRGSGYVLYGDAA